MSALPNEGFCASDEKLFAETVFTTEDTEKTEEQTKELALGLTGFFVFLLFSVSSVVS
jgi:hypothetical protein